ncbi:DUF2922 domain-containing protein [Enterococcus sp. 669A]|uniref:DUF2922 domain-containing protein n=1 Tax=Candidatus Enterococcus moelleringii TaxID=2815325 RepID=A0ABS3L9A7_9ENTE|nr:DUF2922 domain-containing protein [Enterococcus sp. 669A]MBO1305643.1 DUF2922 domain-containing protein [Enterococcus sp. 669A]
MTTAKYVLSSRQINTMKRASLEKRVQDFHSESGNDVYTIQAALAVMIRNALSTEDFSFLAEELIRNIFLTSKAVHEIRLSCVYFRDYFDADQWKKVKNRLFASEAEFEQLTKSTELYIEKLRPRLISKARPTEKKTNMISYFKDGNGKRHSWSLSNVNPDITKEEHYALMSILGTLNIFHKDGVQRFAEPIYADFTVYEPSFDRRDEEAAAELMAKAGQLLPLDASLSAAVESNEAAIDTQIENATGEEDTIVAESAEIIDGPPSKTLSEEEAQALNDFYTAGFDSSSVTDEEREVIAFKAALDKRPMREIQLEMEKEKERERKKAEAADAPAKGKKNLTKKERKKLAQERADKIQRNKQNKRGILSQINKRGGKKRK